MSAGPGAITLNDKTDYFDLSHHGESRLAHETPAHLTSKFYPNSGYSPAPEVGRRAIARIRQKR
jgi:hypothetical protein